MPYSQKNNPMKMMKSALKMYKDDKKSGMHRDSAMYMKHGMHRDSSMYMKDGMHRESSELKDMPVVDIEKGDAKGSPAKVLGPKSEHDMGMEAWEAHKKTMHGLKEHGNDSPAKMKKDSPMEKELVGKQKNLPEHLKKAIEAAPGRYSSKK